MPEEKKKKRLDSDGRATASAMTGHTRTYYDDRYYRWLRDKSGAQSPPRIGASGVNVSGGLAPHHMFGLKLMKNLTSGMSPEDIADINDNYMPVGYRMGDDADWNLIGIEQDVNSGEGTNSGWHKQVHDSQDKLLEKLGFKKTKNGYLLYGKPFNEYPVDIRKGIISHVTHQIEMDTDDVLRRASDDFWNRPQAEVDADLAEIRRNAAAAPPPPPQDYRPTRKATQVMQSQEWADAQDSTAWDRIRASELDNKALQRAADSPGLQNAAKLLGYSAVLPAVAMLPIQAQAAQEADAIAKEDPSLVNKSRAFLENVSLAADKADARSGGTNVVAGGVSNLASLGSTILDIPNAINRSQQDVEDRRENGVPDPQVAMARQKAMTLMDQNNFGNQVNNFLKDPVNSTNQGLKGAWNAIYGMGKDLFFDNSLNERSEQARMKEEEERNQAAGMILDSQ